MYEAIRPGDYVRVDHRGVTRMGRVVAVDGRRVSVRVTDDRGSQRVLNRDVGDVRTSTSEGHIAQVFGSSLGVHNSEGRNRVNGYGLLPNEPDLEAPRMETIVRASSALDELEER